MLVGEQAGDQDDRAGRPAAREIAGRPITMSRERGRLIRNHPSNREETSQNDTYKALIADLKRAKRLVEDELKAVKA